MLGGWGMGRAASCPPESLEVIVTPPSPTTLLTQAAYSLRAPLVSLHSQS